MTTNNTETGKIENIKQLNSMNQQSSDVFTLLNNIKDMRRRLDMVLSEERERERANEAQKRAEQLKIEEASKQERPEKPKEPVAEPVPVAATEENENADVQSKTAAPAPVSAPVAKEKENTDNIRTKQFDTTPSYIRGRITPPPQTQYAPRTDNRPYQPRTGTRPPMGGGPLGGQQRPPFGSTGTFNRPPYQQGARPPYQQGQRPMGQTGQSFGGPKKPMLSKIDLPASKDRKPFEKKKEFKTDDKKQMNKRTLIRKGFIPENPDEERANVRKLKNKKNKEQPVFIAQKIEKAVINTENLTVKILSEKIGKTSQEIIKKLMLLGIVTNINSVVDFSTMELVANELGVELELKIEQTKEERLEADHDEIDTPESLVKRPPLITVMGHVDHGKTSLLDTIRKTSVVSGEAGGITQHIGSYSVMCRGEKITFLDTPGHEAFAQMRLRGAKVTDIAVLVVAADDGIMPQTVEAIKHAETANVPLIVAINKIDKPSANVEKVKQMLMEHNVVAEDFGGETMAVPISAKTGEGIDKLLESILLLAEVNDYRANPDRKAKGSVIEAKLDKGKGPVANIIVQNGTLRVGDTVVSGIASGRIRAMTDDKGRSIKEAGPSTPVSVLGFTDVPNAGDTMFVVSDEKMAKQVVAERTVKIKNEQITQTQKTTLDDVFNKITDSQIKDLNIIIKGDVQGSVEALKTSLLKINNDEARVNVIHGGVGAINKSDILLAEVSKAVVIGFNVRPDAETKTLAENDGIDIRLYKIIYDAIEDIERMISGMATPKTKEVVTGRAQVRNVFKITGSGIVAGSYVQSGKITRNSHARVFRAGEQIFDGQISGLKRFKDDVKDVAENYECGISLADFSDFKELDEIEAYVVEVVK